MPEDERIVRIPLPSTLIRRMDQLILRGAGGFETRIEFIKEAVENQILELTYPGAPKEDLLSTKPVSNGRALKKEVDLASTVLHATQKGPVIENGIATVPNEPLFGLHNRDYPSLWAAREIAELTQKGPVVLDECMQTVTRHAWTFASMLNGGETPNGLKLHALFPTNPAKAESAESAFQAFAIGMCSAKHDVEVRASGPLFTWHICQVTLQEKRLFIGLTTEGYALLEELDGISLQLPHTAAHFASFAKHLRRFASADWSALLCVLEGAQENNTREELVQTYKKHYGELTDDTAATYVAGYVSRAREWGLIEPRQKQGRYVLTDFGVQQLQQAKEGKR